MQNLLIFSDIDNTLYGHDNIVSKFNFDQIKLAQTNNAKFILCTGNPYFGDIASLASKYLNLDYSINCSGAEIIDVKNNKIIYSNKIDKKIIIEILKKIKNTNSFYVGYDETNLFVDDINYFFVDKRIIKSKNKNFKIYNFNNFNNGLLKLDIINTNINKLKDIKTFVDQFDIEVKLINNCIEITNINQTKYSGVMWLTNYLKIDINHIMTIGDSLNDYEMIKFVANSYAMGNACNKIKAVAHFHTTNVLENGLGLAINNFLKRNK